VFPERKEKSRVREHSAFVKGVIVTLASTDLTIQDNRPFIVPERRIVKVVVTYEQRMVLGDPIITERTELYRDCGHVAGWAGMPHRRPQVGDRDGCLTCACNAEDDITRCDTTDLREPDESDDQPEVVEVQP
jgi:hypothetical protein